MLRYSVTMAVPKVQRLRFTKTVFQDKRRMHLSSIFMFYSKLRSLVERKLGNLSKTLVAHPTYCGQSDYSSSLTIWGASSDSWWRLAVCAWEIDADVLIPGPMARFRFVAPLCSTTLTALSSSSPHCGASSSHTQYIYHASNIRQASTTFPKSLRSSTTYPHELISHFKQSWTKLHL